MPNSSRTTKPVGLRLPIKDWNEYDKRAKHGRKYKTVGKIIQAMAIQFIRHDLGRKR